MSGLNCSGAEAFHKPEDGPMERWHMNGAAKAFREEQYDVAYHRLFAAANTRLQKFFMSMGARIQHEKTRNYAVNVMFDETIRMDLSFDGRESMARVLEKGWESARRYYAFRQVRNDPNLPPLECQEQWNENVANVEKLLKALDILSTNEQFKANLLKTLINVPPNISYIRESWEETFEYQKYMLHHHFS